MHNFAKLTTATIGRILVAIGVILTTGKWFFGWDEIGYWTLLFLVPGVILTFAGSRQSSSGGTP